MGISFPAYRAHSHPARTAVVVHPLQRQLILVISVFLMLVVSAILMLLVIQVLLLLIVQVILVILLFRVLVVLATGLFKLRSEDSGITDNTGITENNGIAENTGNTEDTEDIEDTGMPVSSISAGTSWEEDTCPTHLSHERYQSLVQWYDVKFENSEANVSTCQGNGPLIFEENGAKPLHLSAGGAFMLQEENFPPLDQQRCSSMPFTDPMPRKISFSTNRHGRAQLNEAAKFKHIDPTCKSEEGAEKKSLKRNSRYPQEIGEYNTVFQVNPDDFTLEASPKNRRMLKSKQAVRNWKCQKVSNSRYEGREEIPMHAVFLAPEEDCHFSPEESRQTQKPGGSIKLIDFVNQGKSRKKSTNKGSSKIKNSSSGCLLVNSIVNSPFTNKEKAMLSSIWQSL